MSNLPHCCVTANNELIKKICIAVETMLKLDDVSHKEIIDTLKSTFLDEKSEHLSEGREW
jgi:hypothetical protein